jgi:hypothetical protein
MVMELCQMYDGKQILRKHATYQDFASTAFDEEKHH